MTLSDGVNWYEVNLSSRERKKRGHFSTPSLLVEQVLDACGYTSENDLTRLRVLDPACGSGNFLTAALRRLVDSARHLNLPANELLATVQRNVWGIDPDPIACFLAEMQMRAALPADLPQSSFIPHIHQADGLAFPWEGHENVDLFLANPPYLAAKNTDLSLYRSARQRGQTDSYLLFLNLALQVVRPGGWLGLVLPDPILARSNAARERERLLQETTVHHLWHLAGVFSAHVGAVVIIAQKRPATRMHHVNWQRGYWRKMVLSAGNNTINQHLLHGQSGFEFRYLLSRVRNGLIGSIHHYLTQPLPEDDQPLFTRLGNRVVVWRGEEIGKESPFLTTTQPADEQGWHPVLRGGMEVRSYTPPRGSAWLAREQIVKPLERYRIPKLVVVKSTGHLQAALDLEGHIALQTLYLLQLCKPKPGLTQQEAIRPLHRRSIISNELLAPCTTQEEIDELYFLLALLNSRLLQEYVYVLYTAYKWIQPQIEQHVLVNLPIPIVSSHEIVEIVQRAKQIVAACSEGTPVVELRQLRVYEEQERAIYALYQSTLHQKRPQLSSF